MRIVNIVETAYRATLEEQDDTVLWLTRALRNAGADVTVLLRGNAVSYAVRQTCPTLAIGKATIAHPARPNEDLVRLREKGAAVYVVQEDLDDRGIDRQRCIDAAEPIRRSEIVDLLEAHDQVWHW